VQRRNSLKEKYIRRKPCHIIVLLLIMIACVSCGKSDSSIEMVDNGSEVTTNHRYSLIINGDRYERFRLGVSDYSNHGNNIGEVKWNEDVCQVSEINGFSPQVVVFVDMIVFVNDSKSTQDEIIKLQTTLDFVSMPTL
jgi:hypothetical protein